MLLVYVLEAWKAPNQDDEPKPSERGIIYLWRLDSVGALCHTGHVQVSYSPPCSHPLCHTGQVQVSYSPPCSHPLCHTYKCHTVHPVVTNATVSHRTGTSVLQSTL